MDTTKRPRPGWPSPTPLTENSWVTLVGVVHIGDSGYYDKLASVLHENDLEIFEGVRPIGFYGPPFINDPDFTSPEARARLTRQRLFTLNGMLQAYRAKHGSFPTQLSNIFDEVDADDRYALRAVEALDSWGHSFEYSLDGNVSAGFHLISRGADGVAGGTGADRDLDVGDALIPAVDTDALVGALRNSYRKGAQDAQLVNQPRSLSFQTSRFLRADVSTDLIWSDPGNLVQMFKYWNWREQLPGVFLALSLLENPVPKKIAILYGAGHGEKIEEQILGQGFTKESMTWNDVFQITPDLSESVRNSRKKLLQSLD